MLSVEECRAILGLPDLSDEQVMEIRDTLYALAHTLLDAYLPSVRFPHPTETAMSAPESQKTGWRPAAAPAQSPAPSMPQAAVSILRVSTKKQLTEGDGIENQRRGNAEYIRRQNYRLVKEFVIAETADDREREDSAARATLPCWRSWRRTSIAWGGS